MLGSFVCMDYFGLEHFDKYPILDVRIDSTDRVDRAGLVLRPRM
jgi:hypothetical protein